MARDGNAKGMKETKFKDTELGKIPEDWSVAQVGDLFSMKRNNTLSRDNLNYSDLAGYKNIHYGDVLVKFGAFIDVSTDTLPFVNHDIKFNPDLLENGDVIIADTAEDENVGKASEVIGISAKDKVVSGLHTIVLHPNEKFASKYLGYFLNGEAYHNSLYNSMQGTKVISISQKAINATSIAYPSFSEQQRIASALSDADALVAELDALIEKKRAIMAGTMQELLTGKRRLKGFSDPWVNVELSSIGTFIGGGTPSTSNANYWNGKMPWISSADISKGKLNSLCISRRITDAAILNSATKRCPKGTLLIVSRVGVGKIDIAPCEVCTSQDFTNLVVDECHCDIFIAYRLIPILEYKGKEAQGTSIQGISSKEVKRLGITIPASLAEQRAIASILSDMDAEIAELEAKRDKYKEVRQGMMQQLLTGKIRLI